MIFDTFTHCEAIKSGLKHASHIYVVVPEFMNLFYDTEEDGCVCVCHPNICAEYYFVKQGISIICLY